MQWSFSVLTFLVVFNTFGTTSVLAQSYHPCTPEQYFHDPSTSIPTTQELHGDFKIAYRSGDRKLALSILCQAAAAKSPEAEFMLGMVLAEGTLGVGKNDAQARYWYQRAVSQGHADAAFYYGKFYLEGRGGAVDSTKGIRMLRSAAEANLPKAQAWLAYQYTTGVHIEQNLDQAIYWAERSYKLGHQSAKELIEIIEDLIFKRDQRMFQKRR